MKIFLATIAAVAVASSAGRTSAADADFEAKAAACNSGLPPLRFTLVDGDAVAAAVEDDIRADLAKVGITVETVMMTKEDFNAAQTSGVFHLSFTESWGAPYDPHAYVAGWIANDEGHYSALENLDAPSSRSELFTMIEDVLAEEELVERRTQWESVHRYYHAQAISLPLWGKRVPALINTRLQGYEAGNQQFDYPVHRLEPVEGPTTVTIAPGAQSGLFKSVGRMDPHTYRPNEFFSNNWIYEGLLTYGEGGNVLPSLASAYRKTEATDGGDGDTYIFTLRENVFFHDGTPWNCAAAKLNFDHVFAGALTGPEYHGWYKLPSAISGWECTDDMEFTVTTSFKYAPFLQELTFIRPLRMISPASFANGLDSDPLTENSCHSGWGTVELEGSDTVVCAGLTNVSGTGPFAFLERTQSIVGEDTVDDGVTFVRNSAYWGGEPDIEVLKIVRYEDSDAVKAALLAGDLDIVWGTGVLPDRDIAEIANSGQYDDLLRVHFSDDVQNVIMLINSGNPPLDDINVRKTVIHSIDKASIIEKELGGIQKPVDNVFPLDAPYCDVDLTPRWDYDIEKAAFLSCIGQNDGDDDDDNNNLAIGLGVGLGVPLVMMGVVAFMLMQKSQKYEAELKAKSSAVQA